MISRCSRECLTSVIAVTSVVCCARVNTRGGAEESDSSLMHFPKMTAPQFGNSSERGRTPLETATACAEEAWIAALLCSAYQPVNARTENLKCPWLPIAWRPRSVRCRSALAIFWRCRSNRMTLTLLSKSPAVIFLSGRLKMVIALDQPTNVIKLPVSCS